MESFPNLTLEEIKRADEAGLLFAWYGGVNSELCALCNRHRADILLSVVPKGRENEPTSGEIVLMGTTCFKNFKKKHGLKVQVKGGY